MRLHMLYIILLIFIFSGIQSPAETNSLENLEKAVAQLSKDFTAYFRALKDSGQIPNDVDAPDFGKPGLIQQATDDARLDVLEKQVNVFIKAVGLLPVAMSLMPVDLPGKSKANQKRHLTGNIYIDADGAIYFQKNKIPTGSLAQKLRTIADDPADIAIIIAAHPEAGYRHLMAVLKTVRETGIIKVSLNDKTETD